MELTYYDIAEGITAFSTTRHGGYSTGSYAEFNVNEYCGDSEESVSKNREMLCGALSLSAGRLVMPHQTHGVESRQIAADFFSLPPNIRKMLVEGVDALMTNVGGVCIGVSTADCIPILLYDPQHKAVCAVHAGWRGTVASIVLKSIKEMRMAYSTDPSALKAVIGPGISVDAFEVGNEVYEEFQAAGFPMESISRQMPDAGGAEYKWHIDLPACNRMQLMAAGLREENIMLSGICTYNNSGDYFSARRLGTGSGRIFTGIMIRPDK